jgi:hypothetical protein
MYLLKEKLACILVGNIFGITDVDSVTVHNTALSNEKWQSNGDREVKKEKSKEKRINLKMWIYTMCNDSTRLG